MYGNIGLIGLCPCGVQDRIPQPLRLPPRDLTVVFGVEEMDVDGHVFVRREDLPQSCVRAPGVGDMGGDPVQDPGIGAKW